MRSTPWELRIRSSRRAEFRRKFYKTLDSFVFEYALMHHVYACVIIFPADS